MDWNDRYLENDTPWDKGEAAPPLLEYLKKNRIEGSVLIPGCGTGHDSRVLAAHGANALGIDVAPLAIEKAKSYPAPSSGTVSYALGDFFSPELQEKLSRNFDYVFEHTCFCAIDPSMRESYAKAASIALKPGGQLIGIFFTHLESDGGPPHATPFDVIEATFSPYFTIENSWRPQYAYPGRLGEESMILMRKR